MHQLATTPLPADGALYIVGVDGSAPSKLALRWAAFLAGATGGVIEAVAAWQPVNGYAWTGAGMAVPPTDWDPAIEAEKTLVATVDEVFSAQRPPDLQLITLRGHPAKVLVELSVGARMIIVGSRGHGGFAGLLLGSVSAACAEHATCPVLVVHGETPPPHSSKEPS